MKYQTIVDGFFRLLDFLVVSSGAADAGKPVAVGADGRLDSSVMPLGIGAQTISAPASEALGAGKFVNFYSNAGVFSVRLADNSNNRRADGFVTEAVADAATATVYPIDGVNAELSGLTIGGHYWLGTAGGVIGTPLDETDSDNDGSLVQYLGLAKSATELVTSDSPAVTL
jgi:hypothetical protein